MKGYRENCKIPPFSINNPLMNEDHKNNKKTHSMRTFFSIKFLLHQLYFDEFLFSRGNIHIKKSFPTSIKFHFTTKKRGEVIAFSLVITKLIYLSFSFLLRYFSLKRSLLVKLYPMKFFNKNFFSDGTLTREKYHRQHGNDVMLIIN